MKCNYVFVVLFGVSQLFGSVFSQVHTLVENQSLFESNDKLKIKLTADFSFLIKNKEDEKYISANIDMHFADSYVFQKNIRIKPRGYFRKMNCGFPPLMLNFKPDMLCLKDGRYGKVKMVTHCFDSDRYVEYVLKEYLSYKLFALISPYSLQVRLVDVEYVDIGKREHRINQLGFLIEPMDVFCERVNVIEIEGKYFDDDEINELEADRVAIFMYMIGNTDWRIKSGHNIKFLKKKDHRVEEVVPVPYDFDHAGLINANYARPSEWSEAERVTERDYVGRCRLVDTNYDILIQDYLSAKEDVFRTINEFKYLDIKMRKRITKYIESFYKELEKPERFKRSLHHSCMEKY